MNDLLNLDDEISKMIRDKIQGSGRFNNTIFKCEYNCYTIANIELNQEEATMYKKHLDLCSEVNIMKKVDGSNIEELDDIDGSIAIYLKKCQLFNGKNTYMYIVYYDKRVDIISKYEEKHICLERDSINSRGIAIELIMPEFNNITFMMNIDKENQSQR